MPLSTALVVLAGALAGGFVTGLAAFGTGLVALGFWLHVTDPATASTLVAICSVVGQVQTMPTIWRSIDLSRIWPMVAAGLLGVPLGTLLLAHVDLSDFRLGVGLLLLAFATFSLLLAGRARIAWGGTPANASVGLAGGVLGGLSGLSGPLPIIWATLRGWPKDQRRSTLQVFNTAVLGTVILWHAAAGMLDRPTLTLAAVALPGTLLGAGLGIRLYRRLSDRRFHEVVLAVLAASGLSLVFASL